jgi:hypothetical protein
VPICNANANNREPLTVTPIVSKRCLDRIYIDLMEFTSQLEKWLEIHLTSQRLLLLYGLALCSLREELRGSCILYAHLV